MAVEVSAEVSPGRVSATDPDEVIEEDKKADEEGDPSDESQRLERRKRSLEYASDDSDGDETPVEEQYEFMAITSRKMESGKPWYKCYWKFQKGYQYLPEARLRNAGDLEALCDEYMEALKDEPRL
ncbi:Hypothetical protein PHPALM_11374 [Phytophthora palmivora]|uniref:Uncharacterized protein n=1 Tax=Phytophthora palmivora TaxID=4796 RepID=A0A2P4Y2E4_9STRA|nr:Hypothetical protein PHPALM_11374 [Phytophthora palmivora]